MELFPVSGPDFKLDGGAAFGVVPKVIWSMLVTPDQDNLLPVSSRCLLIKTEQRLILIDTGLGNKQSEKYFSNFHLSGNPDLVKPMQEYGFSYDDVTDVIFTHLHFDHCGGAVIIDSNGKLLPAFRNAQYWCTRSQWEWAMNPNSRETASFFKENFVPLLEHNQMQFIEKEQDFCPGIFLKIVNGHTEGQIVPLIQWKGKTLAYMGDFIPTAAHIPLPFVPSYDVRPLRTLQEKEEFLNTALEEDYILFFEHDYYNECCSLQLTKKGIRMKESFCFSDL